MTSTRSSFGTVSPSKRTDFNHVPEVYVVDVSIFKEGYPRLSSSGYNSDVIVYDAATGKMKRKEDCEGKVIEFYETPKTTK